MKLVLVVAYAVQLEAPSTVEHIMLHVVRQDHLVGHDNRRSSWAWAITTTVGRTR